MFAVFLYGFQNGGPAGLVVSFLISLTSTQALVAYTNVICPVRLYLLLLWYIVYRRKFGRDVFHVRIDFPSRVNKSDRRAQDAIEWRSISLGFDSCTQITRKIPLIHDRLAYSHWLASRSSKCCFPLRNINPGFSDIEPSNLRS